MIMDTGPVDRLRSPAGRLAAAGQAIRRPVVDVLIVLVVLFVSLSRDRWGGAPVEPVAWILDVVLVLPLLWRRRRPAEVFLLIAALALIQWLLDVRVGADLAVLFALYAIGAYESRRVAIIGCTVIAEFGVVMAALRWVPTHPDGQSANRLTTALLLTGTITAALAIGFYMRTRRAYLSSVLERAATAERERDQQAVIATATERARISREMHDIVAHSLSVMIALSDGAAIAATRTPEAARTAMLQSSTLGRQALGEMRRLLGGLNGDLGHGSGGGSDPAEHVAALDVIDPDAPAELAPQPGVADLDALVELVRAAGPAVDLVIVGPRPDLPPSSQLTIYRMVQEALTNVLKHAPAATRAPRASPDHRDTV